MNQNNLFLGGRAPDADQKERGLWGREWIRVVIWYLRWPISATAKLTFPRQNLLFHGKA